MGALAWPLPDATSSILSDYSLPPDERPTRAPPCLPARERNCKEKAAGFDLGGWNALAIMSEDLFVRVCGPEGASVMFCACACFTCITVFEYTHVIVADGDLLMREVGPRPESKL